jgi:hypothetical protein
LGGSFSLSPLLMKNRYPLTNSIALARLASSRSSSLTVFNDKIVMILFGIGHTIGSVRLLSPVKKGYRLWTNIGYDFTESILSDRFLVEQVGNMKRRRHDKQQPLIGHRVTKATQPKKPPYGSPIGHRTKQFSTLPDTIRLHVSDRHQRKKWLP